MSTLIADFSRRSEKGWAAGGKAASPPVCAHLSQQRRSLETARVSLVCFHQVFSTFEWDFYAIPAPRPTGKTKLSQK